MTTFLNWFTNFVVSLLFYVATNSNIGKILSFLGMGVFGLVAILFIRKNIHETRWKNLNDCIELHRKEQKSKAYSKDKQILERMLDEAR